MLFRLTGVLFRLTGELLSLSYKSVLTAGHLVYIINHGTPGAAHQNSHYSGNSEIFSNVNKDLILFTEILQN